MTTSRTPSIDQLLAQGLRERAAGGSDDLLEQIVREAASTPQPRRVTWRVLAPPRTLAIYVAIALLLAALAGAAALGFLRPRPTPVIVPVPHANGEIVTRGAGCTMVAIDPLSGTSRELFGGVPSCYGNYDFADPAWDASGTRLALAYDFFCGGCGSARAKAAITAKVSGVWVVVPATSDTRQLSQCQLETAS